MINQRTGITIGIVFAVTGIVVLGADRLTASADANTLYGQAMTVFTVIGLAFLLIAAIVLFRTKLR